MVMVFNKSKMNEEIIKQHYRGYKERVFCGENGVNLKEMLNFFEYAWLFKGWTKEELEVKNNNY